MHVRQPARRHPEQQVQHAVFEHLRWRGIAFAFHPANGGWRSPIEAKILKGSGVVSGVPDVIAICKGQVFALKLKAPGGRLSPAQKNAHARLRAAGAEVATAVGLDAALQRLEAWNLLIGRAS